MARRIQKLQLGKKIKYFDRECVVIDLYPHIAYLHDEKSDETLCVNLGDLVMAGLEASMPMTYTGKSFSKSF